jgi:DNA invertase Pin-like site-specific DNA recombinase
MRAEIPPVKRRVQGEASGIYAEVLRREPVSSVEAKAFKKKWRQMKRVIELIRVSTEQQAGNDREGLNGQRDANKFTAQSNGLTIVKRFEIVDVSGANTLHCPEMQELLSWVERPEIEGIVCVMFSRLIRSQNNSDLATFLDILRENNCLIYLPAEIIDPSTDSGLLIGGIQGLLAGQELRSLIKNMWRGKEAKRRRGIHV